MSLQDRGKARFLEELLLHPLFVLVLLLKLACGAFFASHFMRAWSAPFVGQFALHGGDPWAAFLALGAGYEQAFPYPPGMLYLLSLPRLLFAPLMGAKDFMQVGPAELLLMRLPLLLSDVAIYAVLAAWFRDRLGKVRLWYWCSPVVFYVAYLHGQLDLIPTALLVLCLFLLGRRQLWEGMALLGLGLATKNHLWIALPFILIYLRPQLGWAQLLGLAALPVAVYAALSLPFWGSAAYAKMVLQNEQQNWVFLLSLPMGKWNTSFLLCPAALLFVLAKYAIYPRQNWDLTLLFLGIAFTAFVVLVPPMPGWYLWSMPFIIYYLCRFHRGAPLLMAFSAAYLGYFLLGSRSDLQEVFGLAAPFVLLKQELDNNLAFTLMQGSLSALALVMYTTGVRSNEVYTSRRKPIMLGIAGDSGVGKDRVAAGLAALLGERDLIRLDGDDYHRWERGDENWKLLTHLNPQGNRLHEQLEHMVSLRRGQGISKVAYDHASGRFTAPEPVDPRKNILVQGLHSFVLEQQRRLFDLKVFLDPEERLRKFWKLRRDKQRGHSALNVRQALMKRARDRAATVLPQRAHADLVLRLRPEDPSQLKDFSREPALILEMEARNSYNFEDLAAGLRSLPGLEASVSYPKGLSKILLKVRGPAQGEDLGLLCARLIPDLPDLLGIRPRFPGGLDGVVLLAVMSALCSNLKFGKDLN